MILVYLAGAWLLGVASAALDWGLPSYAAAGFPVLTTAAAVANRRPQFVLLGLLAGALFLLGGLRYDQAAPSPDDGLAPYNDSAPVRFRALVSGEPDIRGRSQRIRLSVRELWEDGDWRAASGGVLVRHSPFPRYRYGDLLEVEGKLETPPELDDFNYRDFLARQGIQSVASYPQVQLLGSGQGNDILEGIHAIRRRLGDALADALPEPQASLGQGILLGQRSALSPSLADDMNDTGVSHIVAVSGYNVSVVAGLVIGGLSWLMGRRQAALVALAAIAFYTLLTGAAPPVVRAAIMGGLFLAATLAGRPGSALTAVVVAAAFMTARHPLALHDVSFQLSFAAVIAIVYVAPTMRTRVLELADGTSLPPDALRRGPGGALLETTAVTIAAILATLPIIALNFGRISVVAPLANLLVVPVFPLQLGLAALTAVAGAAASPLGAATAWLSWLPLAYMTEVVQLLADLPAASVEVSDFGLGHAALAYAGLGVFAWWVQPRPPAGHVVARAASRAASSLRWASGPIRLVPTSWAVGALVIAAALLWWANLSGDSGRLAVSVMDVGQGDAILVRGPAGHKILVDGGPEPRAVREALGRELPFWDRHLDVVLLTHPQDDHLTGLVEVVERYDVDRAMAPSTDMESPAYEAWRDALGRRGVEYIEAQAGQWLDLGAGARLEVLAPPPGLLTGTRSDINNNSVVIKVTWGRVSFLLTGDIEAEGEAALLKAGDLRSTVLKLPHHGSATSGGQAFLRAVRPVVAVISVGGDNPFGHPSPSVLERLGDTLVYRTDRNGRVRLSTDGERLWVEVDRGGASP